MNFDKVLFVFIFMLIIGFLSTLLHSWLGIFKTKYNLETLGSELDNWLLTNGSKQYVSDARLIDYVNYHAPLFNADDNEQNISLAREMSLKKIINEYKDLYYPSLDVEKEVECVVYFPKLRLYEVFDKLKNEIPQPSTFVLLKRNYQKMYTLEHSNYVFSKRLEINPKKYIDDQSFLIMCQAPRLICDDSMTSKMAQKIRNKNAISLNNKFRYTEFRPTVAILSSFKNAAASIKEWLFHHAFEGVTQFVLIDDNSTDTTKEEINKFLKHWHETKIDLAILPPPKQKILVNQLRHYDHLVTTTWAIHVKVSQFVYARDIYKDIISFAENIPENVDSIYLFWKIFNIPNKNVESLIKTCTKRQGIESCLGVGQTMYRVSKLPNQQERVRLKNLNQSTGKKYMDASGKQIKIDVHLNDGCKFSNKFKLHLNYYKYNMPGCDEEDGELRDKQKFRQNQGMSV